MCKNSFPCASPEFVENDSAEPSNLRIPCKPFCPNRYTYKDLFQHSFSPTVTLTKLLLWVLGRKGHTGKSLWGSIRQFSVRSVADTQVIYSEGAAAMIGSDSVCMWVDILPCLPNLILNTGHDKRFLQYRRAVRS